MWRKVGRKGREQRPWSNHAEHFLFKKKNKRHKRRQEESKHFHFLSSLRRRSFGGKLASRYPGKYQTAWRGIKGISAAQRSGDAKRLLREGAAGRSFISGRQLEPPQRQRYSGLQAQWGCSKMTFPVQICSNGISDTFKQPRRPALPAEMFIGGCF